MTYTWSLAMCVLVLALVVLASGHVAAALLLGLVGAMGITGGGTR